MGIIEKVRPFAGDTGDRPSPEGTLPADVYGAIRGWKERAKAEAQKKREAIAQRDELAARLEVRSREFRAVFAAVECGRLSKRARLEIRELVKYQLGYSDAEMLKWVQKKAAELPTLENP